MKHSANKASPEEHTRSTGAVLLEEIRRPGGFILALIVGGTLTYTRRFESVAVYLPFVVPYLVSVVTRSVARLKARRQEMLLDLPAYRRDPAFIMDCEGRIVASAGETEALFIREDINHLDQFLQGPEDCSAGSVLLGGDREKPEYPFFSPVTNRWYTVQLRGDRRANDWLVWLDNVTERVHLEERKDALREFTHRLQHELLERETGHSDDMRLAQLLLSEGYQAVMLARLEAPGDEPVSGENASARGIVYTADSASHGPVTIAAGAEAPIMRSRREGRAVWDDARSWASRTEFERTYPVLPEVAAILGSPVLNFANYHSGDVSIIAFNKAGRLNPGDIAVLESAADTAVTAFSLLDLARRADRRFIQSIHGVCAAAEYSDELTGGHIWRVNDYSRHIAETLGLDPRLCEEIGTVAALHDIGKVAIPHLIKLERSLTEPEREEMQMHTIYGTQIVDRMRLTSGESDPRLRIASEIALHHHQHWNGTGYPGVIDDEGTMLAPHSRDIATYRRLRPAKETEIPLPALIVSLADKYDALRSCRQYKPAFSHARVRDLLARDDRSGLPGEEVFGSEVFRAFMDTHGELERIYAEGQTEVLCDV